MHQETRIGIAWLKNNMLNAFDYCSYITNIKIVSLERAVSSKVAIIQGNALICKSPGSLVKHLRSLHLHRA